MQQNTKLFQYVDTPFMAKFDKFGDADVLFENNSILSIDGYRKVCMELYGEDVAGFSVDMGKISGATLSCGVANNEALGAKIHCYDVIGPEMVLWLHGKPNTTSKVQLWVYLIP